MEPKKHAESDLAKEIAQSAKRQRSTKGGALSRKGKTFIEDLDKGFKNGLIPKDLWRRMVNDLHGRLGMCIPTLSTVEWTVAKVEKVVGLWRHVVFTLNEETVKILEKSEVSGGIELEADAQEPDLEEPTEEGHPEGMSDEKTDILKGYTSEESDLARALRGVGMEENSV
ncbi:hypothetical protein KR074_007289, partial [Drosophila pseudoananassae]